VKRPDWKVECIEQIVIAKIEGNNIGLVVDEVIGKHQTAIKSSGQFYREVEGLSGAPILGNGTVALILDV
jgi:two-component system chemotaxis sensor kinase CheA